MARRIDNLLYIAPDVDCPGTHGGSTHVSEAVGSLATLCSHVYLLCKHSSGQPYYEQNKQITILRIPIPSFSALRVAWYFLSSFFTALFLILFRDVSVIYERGRIFGGGGVLAGALLGRKTVYELIEPYLTIPVLLGDITESSFLYMVMRQWHLFVTNRASLITATHTSALKDISHRRVLFIHTGANPKRFKPQKPSSFLQKKYNLTPHKTILYIGSFSPWHACEQLLHAVARLVKSDTRVRLLMIGSGQQYTDCVRLAERLDIMPYVHFIGKIPLDTLPQYINVSAICVALFNRNYTPFKTLGYYYSPIKVHEYKACGKTLVVSDYPLLRELVQEGVHGYAVDETNINALTKVLSYLLYHPQLLRNIGANNRKNILAFYTWDRYNKLILDNLFKQ